MSNYSNRSNQLFAHSQIMFVIHLNHYFSLLFLYNGFQSTEITIN